jgi:3'(2'), 5'-bisphosphate nucleotidase
MPTITPQELGQLSDAVRSAGQALMELWPGDLAKRGAASINASSKQDGSPVTEADIRSNQILIECLTKVFPKDAILSEESPFSIEELAKSNRTWVIDPLDGTRSFINGADDFSVLVGLCIRLQPVYGIMFFPARGRFVIGSKDEGVSCNGQVIAVSSAQTLRPGRIYIRNFECRSPELASPMMDSGEALFRVASGELDGAIIRMTTHREWDLAAPAAIIEAAGGVLTSETGSRIPLGRGEIDFHYLIASNGLIHRQLQHLIAI